jgi:hypothetical protein
MGTGLSAIRFKTRGTADHTPFDTKSSVIVEQYKEVVMPYFLTQASYTSEAWNALMRNRHNRFEALRPVVEK